MLEAVRPEPTFVAVPQPPLLTRRNADDFSTPLEFVGCAGLSPQPLTWGMPLAKGSLQADEELWLVDKEGNGRCLQQQVLTRWSDGSVRWLLLDTVLPASRQSGGWMLRKASTPSVISETVGI